MTAETLIYSALTADTTTAALVSTRVYPLIAAQGTAVPFVVVSRIATNPTNTLGSESATHRVRFQVDCYDDDLTDCGTLADAVQAAMLAASTFKAIRLDRRPTFEDTPELYRTTMDFSVWTT